MKVLHFKGKFIDKQLLVRYLFIFLTTILGSFPLLGQTYTEGTGYIRKVIAKGSDPGTNFNTLYIDKTNNRIILMKPVASGSPDSRLVSNDFSGFGSNLTSIAQPIAALSNSFIPTEADAFYKDVSASTTDRVRLISGSERTFNVGTNNIIAGFVKLGSKDYLVSRNTSTNAVTFRSVDTDNTTNNTSLGGVNFTDTSTPSTLSNLAKDGTYLFYRGNAAIRVIETDGTSSGSSLLLTYNYADDNTNYGTSNFRPTFLTSGNGCIYELATKTNTDFKVRKITYDGSTLVFSEVGTIVISTATTGKYSSVQYSTLKFNTSTNELDASGAATHDVITVGSTGASPSTSNATDIIVYIFNNAPTTADKTVTTDEDTELTLVTSDFSFSDTDGDLLHSIIITQLETDGELKLDGVDVTLNQVISKADLDANKLKFTPSPGEFGTAYATFKFKVIDSFNSMDANNTGYSIEKTITINVDEVISGGGTPPTADDENITSLEDADYKFTASDFNNSFNDTDTDDFASVIITSLPSNGTLEYNGATISVNQEVTLADFTAEKLIFTPDADENGTNYTTFNFKVKDDSGADDISTSTYTMTINITTVNDAPSFTKGADEEVNEDAGAQTVTNWATALEQGGGSDEDTQTLSFVVSNDNNSLFSAQPAISATGELTYTPAANANGSATVTVKIQDDGGTTNSGVNESAEQTFTITVNAVNDAPSFTKSADEEVNEDAGAQTITNWATDLEQGGGSDEDTQNLSFVVSNDNNSLFSAQPAISASGELTYTPAANANGSATVTVKIQDNGGTANSGVDESAEQTFTITVNAVNDAPSFTKGADEEVNEDAGAQTVTNWATDLEQGGGSDEDSQTLSFVVSNDNNSLFSTQPAISATGELTYTPAANANGSATVTVKIQDNGNTANSGVDESAEQTFTITVNAVNDAPSFTKGADEVVNEDAGAQTVTNWASDLEQGGGSDEDTQTLSFVVSNDNNSLFSTQPAISASGELTYTPADNANGSATVTVKIQDNGGTANSGVDESAEQTFTITVNAVNDAPSFTKGADEVVNEDAGAQTVTNWASDLEQGGGSDEDSQTLSFVVSNDNNSLFSAQPAISASGELTYTPADNANGSATVTVKIQDNGGTDNSGVNESAEQTFTITVNAIDDNPSADDESVNGSEDTNYVFATNDFTNDFSDVDEGQILARVVITSLPTDGLLYFDEELVEDSDLPLEVSNANFAALKLVFVPNENENGSPYATLKFKVKDNGIENNLSEEYTMTINIESVNDAPTANNESVSMIEGNNHIFTVNHFNNEFQDIDDHEFQSVIINSLPDKGTLSFNGIALTSEDLPKEVLPSDFDSDYLVFTPITGEYNSPYSSFEFKVKDSGTDNNESEVYTMTLNVLENPCKPILGLEAITSNSAFTLSWSVVEGATSYNVKVYLQGSNTLAYSTTTTSNSFSKTNVVGGTYSWSVSANIPDCNIETTLTNGNNFVVNTCSPISTSSIAGINSFKLSWSSVPSANNQYSIKIYPLASTTSIYSYFSNTTSFVGTNIPEGNYYWTITYKGSCGNVTQFGSNFSILACTIFNNLTGLHGVGANKSFTLSWNEMIGDFKDLYRYDFRVRVKGTTTWKYQGTVKTTTYTRTNIPSGIYEWEARGRIVGGSSSCFGGWKKGNDFAVSGSTLARESDNEASINETEIFEDEHIDSIIDLGLIESIVLEEISAKVYPNPNNGLFNIDFNFAQDNNIIEIFNLMGQKVYENSISSSTHTINLTNQSRGIYFAKISNDKNSITVKFVIE